MPKKNATNKSQNAALTTAVTSSPNTKNRRRSPGPGVEKMLDEMLGSVPPEVPAGETKESTAPGATNTSPLVVDANFNLTDSQAREMADRIGGYVVRDLLKVLIVPGLLAALLGIILLFFV